MGDNRVSKWINILLAVIIVSAILFIVTKPERVYTTPKEVAECIGENSILYTQLGCLHCEEQEKIFGDNLEHVTKVDCFFELEKCEGITATPTWEIKNEKIVGVKTIEELKELTGC